MENYIDSIELEICNELKKKGFEPSINKHIENNSLDDRVINDLMEKTGVKYSDEQLKILHHKGSACILACAGSGKTTTSIHLIAKRLLTGELRDSNKMIYTTFSKAGANEMSDRLHKLLKQVGVKVHIDVRTLHSFYLQILRTFGVSSDIISASQRSKFIREAAKDSRFQLKDDDLMLLDNLLSYQINNMLSDEATVDSFVNTLDIDKETYSNIRKLYAMKKNDSKLIDYDDMQTYLYLWLVKFAKSNNPNENAIAEQVRSYCQALWTDFYIDEAQDVSKIQFAILKAMITKPETPDKLIGTLVFIGDDDQCIYQWRGSDPSIILSISPMFDISTFVLSTNYRCMSSIVDYATPGIKCNSSRYNKSMIADKQGGSVHIVQSTKKDLNSLSKIAFEQIQAWKDSNIKLSEIAVLSRNNFHLSILNNMLFRAGISCRINDEMKLTKSQMYKDVKSLLNICDLDFNVEDTALILWKLVPYLKMTYARTLADFQRNMGLCFEDLMGYTCKHIFGFNVDFDKKLNISPEIRGKISYLLKNMSLESQQTFKTIYRSIKAKNPSETFALVSGYYLRNTEYFYKTVDRKRSIQGIMDYIKSLLNELGYKDLMQFLRTTEQFESGRLGIIGDPVTLTTIHSAKGREWQKVIMFACDNVSMPSIELIHTLKAANTPEKDIKEYINEERRLFYVGNTRAKDELFVITYDKPSMFMLESLGLITEDDNRTVIYYSDYESTLYDRLKSDIKDKLNNYK